MPAPQPRRTEFVLSRAQEPRRHETITIMHGRNGDTEIVRNSQTVMRIPGAAHGRSALTMGFGGGGDVHVMQESYGIVEDSEMVDVESREEYQDEVSDQPGSGSTSGARVGVESGAPRTPAVGTSSKKRQRSETHGTADSIRSTAKRTKARTETSQSRRPDRTHVSSTQASPTNNGLDMPSVDHSKQANTRELVNPDATDGRDLEFEQTLRETTVQQIQDPYSAANAQAAHGESIRQPIANAFGNTNFPPPRTTTLPTLVYPSVDINAPALDIATPSTAASPPELKLEMVHSREVTWVNGTRFHGDAFVPHDHPMYRLGGKVHRMHVHGRQSEDVMICIGDFCAYCCQPREELRTLGAAAPVSERLFKEAKGLPFVHANACSTGEDGVLRYTGVEIRTAWGDPYPPETFETKVGFKDAEGGVRLVRALTCVRDECPDCSGKGWPKRTDFPTGREVLERMRKVWAEEARVKRARAEEARLREQEEDGCH